MSHTRPAPRLLAVAIAAAASSLPATIVHAQEATSGLEEVVVTARRTAENLQDIPVSVQAVSGETIQKLAITRPEELSKLSPGLTIRLSDPSTPVVILRGVRWTQASGTPAIPIYLNEISFDPFQVLQTLYDVGQVEVLRGPQGTSRGAPSISGAVTIGTQRPDLEAVEGYVSGLAGEDSHLNMQGAVNVPLIKDKLAVRFAATWDDSEGNHVRSVNNAQDPNVELRSGRVSLRFQPTEDFLVDGMWQRLDLRPRLYTQLAGPGSPGIPALGVPANFNGPALSVDDYSGVSESFNDPGVETDLITVNLSWNILGQVLSYNFGSQNFVSPQPSGDVNDPTNLLVGWDEQQLTINRGDNFYDHELRLSSDRGEGRFWDYAVGYFDHRVEGKIRFEPQAAMLNGAFGNPFTGPPSPFVDRAAIDHYGLRTATDIGLDTENHSYYGSLTLHLPYETELSGGLRWISDKRPTSISTKYYTPAYNALFAAATCPPSPTITASPIYPGVCDLDISALLPSQPDESYGEEEKKTIYNVSLSHRFTDDVLAYTTVGTSWRQGLPSIANNGLPSDLLIPDPEEATSYEIGVKTSWGGWLRVNAAVFQIDYTGQLTQFQGIPYWNPIPPPGTEARTGLAFFYNADAQVRGTEIEILAEPVDNLTLGLNFSYAKIESEGGDVPCEDPGRPIGPTNPINFCATEKGATLNAAPEYQTSFTGAYVMPIGAFEGYARFVADYQGHNPNFGASRESTNSFTTVDLFVGLTGAEGAWDIGLYGKNVFDEQVELTRNGINAVPAGVEDTFGPSGYERVTATLPREVGLSMRYSFGSL